MGSFNSAAPDDDEQLVVDCLITPSDYGMSIEGGMDLWVQLLHVFVPPGRVCGDDIEFRILLPPLDVCSPSISAATRALRVSPSNRVQSSIAATAAWLSFALQSI